MRPGVCLGADERSIRKSDARLPPAAFAPFQIAMGPVALALAHHALCNDRGRRRFAFTFANGAGGDVQRGNRRNQNKYSFHHDRPPCQDRKQRQSITYN
jgi:hypothetical protein